MSLFSIHWMLYCTGTGDMAKRDFVQYQFVLPLEAKKGLVEILHRISDKGTGFFPGSS